MTSCRCIYLRCIPNAFGLLTKAFQRQHRPLSGKPVLVRRTSREPTAIESCGQEPRPDLYLTPLSESLSLALFIIGSEHLTPAITHRRVSTSLSDLQRTQLFPSPKYGVDLDIPEMLPVCLLQQLIWSAAGV